MDIKLINRGATGELIFVGRLDANSAPEAEEIVKQMIERFDTIVLNMEQLDYISSAGLRVIKIIHMGMKKKNGELILTKVQKMVMEVFEMVGFAGLLKFESPQSRRSATRRSRSVRSAGSNCSPGARS